ncbi:MAG TPA: serine hydrolase [Vicinamibacteria bacterium]|nr:serine hydrolase [Vicinamibacteria bacterium]
MRRRRTRALASPKPTPAARKAAPVPESLARVENSLYLSIQAIRKRHALERLGISFYDSQTTLNWSYNADAFFHAASTIKLAVLVGVYGEVGRGRLTAEAPVHVRNRFASIVEGRPFTLNLDWEPNQEVARKLGRTMTVRDLAYHMITTSSNFATNLLIDVVGIAAIQRALEELKVEGIVMLRGVQDEAAFQAGLNNQVTANGLLKLLRMIAEGRAWSPETCAQMLEIMLDQRFKSGIPAGLPGDVHVAHKTGNISTVHHDAGIIYRGTRNPYFLVVLTQFPAAAKKSGAVAEVSKDLFETLGRLPRASELALAEGGPPVPGPAKPSGPRA